MALGILIFAVAVLGLLIDTGRYLFEGSRLQGAADSCAWALILHPEWSDLEANAVASWLVSQNSLGRLTAMRRNGALSTRCDVSMSNWSTSLLTFVGGEVLDMSRSASAATDPASSQPGLTGLSP